MPTSAANFVELEALRWENRKLSDAKAVAETEVWPPPVLQHSQAFSLCTVMCLCWLLPALQGSGGLVGPRPMGKTHIGALCAW